MSPVSGIIADKFNRKWLIVVSLFVWSGVTWMMGYATTFNQLYWLRAVMGGGAMPGINRKDSYKEKFLLPNIHTQEIIAADLDA